MNDWPWVQSPLPLLQCYVKICQHAFATDAIGSNDHDEGGYGVVARVIDTPLLRDALEAGRAPGFTIARLSGDMSGSRFPNKKLSATKPFSLLDPTWFTINS